MVIIKKCKRVEDNFINIRINKKHLSKLIIACRKEHSVGDATMCPRCKHFVRCENLADGYALEMGRF